MMDWMPFEFKREKKIHHQINPRNSGYTHTANLMSKIRDLNLENTKYSVILNPGATQHLFATAVLSASISRATNPITVNILDGSKLTA